MYGILIGQKKTGKKNKKALDFDYNIYQFSSIY